MRNGFAVTSRSSGRDCGPRHHLPHVPDPVPLVLPQGDARSPGGVSNRNQVDVQVPVDDEEQVDLCFWL
jgi:hypothetical protein